MFADGCSTAVFCRSAVLQFAVLREPQSPCTEARRFGCRRAHPRRLRSLYSERAYVVSSQALLRSVLCCSRAEAGGASFASLRRAGLRLARLKPVFSSVNCNYPSKSSGFYEFGLHSTLVDLRTNRTSFPSTFPRCRQLHIPVCRGVCEQCVMGNFKVCDLAPGAGSR